MPAQRESGFTLFELLVVIALVGVAAAVLSTALGTGMKAAQERSAVTAMVASLHRARVQAISTGQPVRATFDLNARYVVLGEQHSSPWPRDLDVHLHTASTLGTSFAFYPDGASSGGHVQVNRGERQWRIDIAWLTGRVTLTTPP